MSWFVVYILASDQADAIPGDESPVPHNGNPHPLPDAALEPDFHANPHDDAPMPGWGNWDDDEVADNQHVGQGGWDDVVLQ